MGLPGGVGRDWKRPMHRAMRRAVVSSGKTDSRRLPYVRISTEALTHGQRARENGVSKSAHRDECRITERWEGKRVDGRNRGSWSRRPFSRYTCWPKCTVDPAKDQAGV